MCAPVRFIRLYDLVGKSTPWYTRIRSTCEDNVFWMVPDKWKVNGLKIRVSPMLRRILYSYMIIEIRRF